MLADATKAHKNVSACHARRARYFARRVPAWIHVLR